MSRYDPARDNRKGAAARAKAEAARERAWASFEAEVEAALAEVHAAVRAYEADGLGTDAGEADPYRELANSITASCLPKVGAEVRRRLGF